MTRTLIIAAIATLFLGAAFATNGTNRPVKAARFILIDSLEKPVQTYIRATATKGRMAALQQEIARDASLRDRLRARGIPIRNVIGQATADDGATIFYIR